MRFYFVFQLKKILQLLVLSGFLSGAHAGAYEDFFKALELDDSRTLSTLLLRGFDPNTADPKGQVPLFVAFRQGSEKSAKLLLEHPELKVDAVNASGETPVMMAAMRGRIDAVRALLDKGAAVNREGWSPLHYAATGPEVAIVRLLLERGAAVDARSPNGTTPMMMAAQYGNPDSAVLLLERRADPRARNDLGLSAADFARAAGRDALANRLEAAAR